MKDLRQSENWGKYLGYYGWTYEWAGDVLVLIKKAGLVSFIKIQKPERVTEEEIKKIDEIAKKYNALFVKIEVKSEDDTKLLQNAGFQKNYYPLENPSTLLIDLTQSENELWQKLKKDAKYGVNFAQRNGVQNKIIQNPQEKQLKEFWEVLSESGREHKYFVQPFEDMLTKARLFKEGAVLSAAYKDEKMVAGSLTLIVDDAAFYIHAAASKEGKKLLAAYLSLWSLIQHLKGRAPAPERACKTLDLEGIVDERFAEFTKNWYGFTFFKKKFGGDEVSYPYPYIKYYNKWVARFNKKFPLPI